MKPAGTTSDTKVSQKVSPPASSYMNNDQFASYLSELRNNRLQRPGGARPQPSGVRPAPNRASIGRPSLDTISRTDSQTSLPPQPRRVPSQAPSVGAASVSSRLSTSSRGRDYYPQERTAAAPLRASEVVPTSSYMERGQRWMEKEEAFSLRDAMYDMRLRETPEQSTSPEPNDDARLYDAALNEAAELVWQHQNPDKIPQPDGPYRYRPHLRKNSYAHARAASVGRYGEDIAASGLARDSGARSVSASSSDSDGASRMSRPSVDSVRTQTKSYGSMGARTGTFHRRRSSMKRNVSGEVERPFSGDQIWEEPESASSRGSVRTGRASPDKLVSKPTNPLNRVRFDSLREEAAPPGKTLDRVEIYRNPPTKSRDALYTSNAGLPEPTVDETVERKDGIEVRSQDIRNATSMKLKDRSAKLPEPTAVSDSPGRPIVSFDANWRAPEESTDSHPAECQQRQRQPQPQPEAAAGSPARGRFQTSQARPVGIPTISVEESDAPRTRASPNASVPSISLEGPGDAAARPLPEINVPTIAVDGPAGTADASIPVIVTPDDGGTASPRPLPEIHVPGIFVDSPKGGDKNVPAVVAPGGRNRAPRAQRPLSHWSRAPGAPKDKTLCHECGYSIEGRFVALAGTSERFHPKCLRCYICGTSLEAMEISPEPDRQRAERIERIQRRAAGEILEETPGQTMAEDGDDRLRFYCHLDWHEHFAPKCKHCKTSILGEHIVALGEHWHYGHFFCAECGDPFEQGMTHIEKDGYAWCIKCQTKRTERRAPKCRKCRTAVIGEYIQALGYEWHEHCFRCAECKGGFEDGQIFPKEVPGGTVVLCTTCRTRELKR